jgi:spore coat-associated protein N
VTRASGRGRHRAGRRAGRHAAPRRQPDSRLVVAVVAPVVALLSLSSFGSVYALFTASAGAPEQRLSTGTLGVGVTGPAGGSATISFASAHPGASVVQPLSVSNDGSLDMRYAVSSQAVSGSAPLAEALRWTVRSGVTDCSAAGFEASGTQLFDGVLATSTKTAKIGDPVQGAQVGDREIAAGAVDGLCSRVTLPTTAASNLQGLSVAVTLSYDAEQQRNI